MTTEPRYVAAIEISSSKIICAVGRYTPDGSGQLTVDAVEQEEIREIVKYGIIQNLEETAMRVRRIIDKIQRRPGIAPRKVTGVFVGLSGRSLRSIETTVRIPLPDDTEITEEIISRLRSDALNSAIDSSLEVVDAVPRTYTVGKLDTATPIGAIGNEISVTYDIIVCRPEMKRNLQRTLEDKAGLKVEGFVVTPLATGHLVLSGEEKRLGCMLVDMGAETTTVSIYKGGALRYLVTLPMGGRNITRDLTDLSLLEEKAEEIKRTSNAIAPENPSTLNVNGVRMADVSNYVVARSEEIAANIVAQMEYSGIRQNDLPGGIVCIGGGARLNGMAELLNQQSKLNVRIGHVPDYIHSVNGAPVPADALEVACDLYEGATLSNAQCLAIPEAEELPATGEANQRELPPADDVKPTKPKGSSPLSNFLGKWRNKMAGMFSNPENEDSEYDSLD